MTFYYSFAFFYDTPKLIFVSATKLKVKKISSKVTKPFANFKTQLSHQYLSLSFNFSWKKGKNMYLELPRLFYMKLKVKVHPTEKLHFKLGFSNWYLENFQVSFSLYYIFPVKCIERYHLKDASFLWRLSQKHST